MEDPDLGPYDPLAGIEKTEADMVSAIIEDLKRRPCWTLPPKDRFEGAGVYLLYYAGKFPGYREIANPNKTKPCTVPIYVGKAVPPGARTGVLSIEDIRGPHVWRRLKEHARSIEQVANLKVDDFTCQFLVVKPVWIRLVEELLIMQHLPWWNRYIDGFGNHDPGKGRYNQARSQWDILHPGRYWADRLPPGPSPKEVWDIVKQRIKRDRV